MMRFRDFSIKTKLTVLGAASNITALALGCVIFAASDIRISLLVMAVALAAVVAAIYAMKWCVSQPILRLAETSQRILADGDYGIRPSWDCEDEIGGLHMAFNLLLDQIEASESARQNAQAELAQLRDLALTVAVSEEIAERDEILSALGNSSGAGATVATFAAGEPTDLIASTLPTDDADFREIVEEFVDRLHQQVGAMQQALSRGDLDELARLAHWLKGAGGSAGFPALTAPAKHLETVVKLDQCDEIDSAISELLKITARIVKPSQCPVVCS